MFTIILLLSLTFASQSYADQPSSIWYVSVLKKQALQSKTLISRVKSQDKTLCGNKSFPIYSQCLRDYISNWQPVAVFESANLGITLVGTILQNKKEGKIDAATAQMMLADGALLILERTDPKNLALLKYKPAGEADRKVYEQIVATEQKSLDNMQSKLLEAVAKIIGQLQAPRQPASDIRPSQKEYISSLRKRFQAQMSKNWKLQN